MDDPATRQNEGGQAARDRGGAPSLKRRASAGALWVLAGHGAGQVLRLGSNLVLTRLLFPEAFGLMALVQIFLQAMQMFSEVGIRASIVQHARGGDRVFLDTAWTVQILRGVVLWVICLIGAYPFAMFYDEHALASLIPAAGLSALIAGFNSTRLAVADRKIRLERVTLIEIGSQAAAIAVMITWAAISPSVWALVAGGVARPAVKMAASHLLLPGGRDRIGGDRDPARELFRFGRWIFLATLLTFVLQQGDKMIVGKLIDPGLLGVYAIAVLWSRMAVDVGLKIGAKVMFPALAEVANKRRENLRSRFLHARLAFLAVLLPVTWGLAVFGDVLIEWLYDDRYAAAGWMVRLLAPGFAGAVISGLSGNVQLAVGDSFRQMIVQVTRGVLLIAGIAVGWHLGSLPGLLVGVSASKILDYPVVAWGLRKHGVWLPMLDLGAFAATAVVVALGWFLRTPAVPW